MSNNARFLRLLLSVIATLAVAQANATIINSLPYNNSPDWTVIVQQGTSMIQGSSQTTLSTAQNAGVWFGSGVGYGDPTPWTLGTDQAGNYVELQASLGTNSADWEVALHDKTYVAGLLLNPTGCANNCYGLPPEAGLDYFYADAADPTTPKAAFVPLDLSTQHTFELLLKNGLVSYRIDGQLLYASQALQEALSANPELLIGDGSGSTKTGVGTMTVFGVQVDTAPSADVSVPEPGTYSLMLLGLTTVLIALRQRRNYR